MWIKREILAGLQDLGAQFPVVAVVGPRQVGKTSLLERSFPGLPYASMDVGAHADLAETRPEEFLLRFAPPAILDEIQQVPAFFRRIKTYVDAHRDRKGLFFLSGSQHYLLMEHIADSLAGRVAIIPLHSLSGSEWCEAMRPQSLAEWLEFLWRGGFPGLWNAEGGAVSRDRWYQGYVATYLERDVRNIGNIGSLRDFERFLRACAARCAQMLNMSDLARDVGISPTTARQWISVLQASNQIFLLEPYYRSLGKRLVKSPKLYFTDTGLASFLMGFDSKEALLASPWMGALWENYVIAQWLRYRDWHKPAISLWYYRDQSGVEVDLVVEANQQAIPIECKYKEHPDERDAKHLAAFVERYGQSFCPRTGIVSLTPDPYELANKTTVLSGWTMEQMRTLLS